MTPKPYVFMFLMSRGSKCYVGPVGGPDPLKQPLDISKIVEIPTLKPYIFLFLVSRGIKRIPTTYLRETTEYTKTENDPKINQTDFFTRIPTTYLRETTEYTKTENDPNINQTDLKWIVLLATFVVVLLFIGVTLIFCQRSKFTSICKTRSDEESHEENIPFINQDVEMNTVSREQVCAVISHTAPHPESISEMNLPRVLHPPPQGACPCNLHTSSLLSLCLLIQLLTTTFKFEKQTAKSRTSVHTPTSNIAATTRFVLSGSPVTKNILMCGRTYSYARVQCSLVQPDGVLALMRIRWAMSLQALLNVFPPFRSFHLSGRAAKPLAMASRNFLAASKVKVKGQGQLGSVFTPQCKGLLILFCFFLGLSTFQVFPPFRDFGPLAMEESTLAEQNDIKVKGQENLELIEAGKAGPVGSPNEPPSPKQPIRDQKTAYLTTDVNILENGIGLEHELPDINFQSSGIWDEIRIDSVTSPSTTQVLTISAAPLTGPATIATGNGSLYGILTCTSPLTQNSSVTPSS
eukprot:XP_019918303.1 PREDICTED: uncharacterized protein LOC105317318 [Crassostrea gigas]